MQYLAKDELLRVLAIAKEARERDWLMFLVAYWHGLRASEVVTLQRHAVANGFLTVRRLKGSDTTTQPLIEDVDPLLNERSALEGDDCTEPGGECQRRRRLDEVLRELAAAVDPDRQARDRHPGLSR